MNIENSNTVKPDDWEDHIDDSYPNLHFMGMQGFGGDPERKDVIEMLCSKCNTGRHHGYSEPKKATAMDMGIASFSKYNMTTPADHIPGSVIRSSDGTFSYTLSRTAALMLSQMEQYCRANNINELDVTKHPLYNVWDELGASFDIRMVEYYKDDIGVDIETIANGGTIPYLKTKRRWRDNQSNEERDRVMRVAKLKRSVKALKRKIHNSDDLHTEELMEVHKMEAELVELKA